MTAVELIARCRERGVELTPVAPDGIRIRPASAVSAELREQIRQHKAEVFRLLAPPGEHEADVTKFVTMPLLEYAQHGAPLEVRVAWLPETLWFVPDEHHAAALVADGVSRGRIWTAAELADLMAAGDPDAVQVVALAKLEFNGEVVEVRPR